MCLDCRNCLKSENHWECDHSCSIIFSMFVLLLSNTLKSQFVIVIGLLLFSVHQVIFFESVEVSPPLKFSHLITCVICWTCIEKPSLSAQAGKVHVPSGSFIFSRSTTSIILFWRPVESWICEMTSFKILFRHFCPI